MFSDYRSKTNMSSDTFPHEVIGNPNIIQFVFIFNLEIL